MAMATNGHAASPAFLAEVDGLRDRIAMLEAERTELASAPRSKEEATELVDRWLDTVGARHGRVDDLAGEFYSRRAEGRPDIGPHPNLPVRAERFGFLLLCACRAQVRELIVGELEAFYERRDVPSADARKARLGEIDAALLALNLSEEAIVRRAEGAGFDLARRATADPRAVLADDRSIQRFAGAGAE